MDTIISKIITPELVDALRKAQPLTWHGIHGVSHWQRVRQNGLRLAKISGADAAVVECFAFLHDIKRLNDGRDPQHGQRAADFARTIRTTLIHLGDVQFDLLLYACAEHTRGLTHTDITIGTCWDADRLDLARVDIIPDPKRLCTEAARDPDILKWAVRRSRAGLDSEWTPCRHAHTTQA